MARDPAVQRAWQRQYRRVHGDRLRAYARRRYNEHKEEISSKRRAAYAVREKKYYEGTKARYIRHLRQEFGLTKEQYDALVLKQEGVCAICKQPNQHTKRLHVDHKHGTKQVRGLLCNHCNSALGLVRENILILDAMRQYLLEHA